MARRNSWRQGRPSLEPPLRAISSLGGAATAEAHDEPRKQRPEQTSLGDPRPLYRRMAARAVAGPHCLDSAWRRQRGARGEANSLVSLPPVVLGIKKPSLKHPQEHLDLDQEIEISFNIWLSYSFRRLMEGRFSPRSSISLSQGKISTKINAHVSRESRIVSELLGMDVVDNETWHLYNDIHLVMTSILNRSMMSSSPNFAAVATAPSSLSAEWWKIRLGDKSNDGLTSGSHVATTLHGHNL